MRRGLWGLRLGTCALVLTASVSSQTPAAQTPAPPATGTGVIMGRVVDAGTGQPIAEAIVTLEPDSREQSESMAAVRQARQAGDMMSFADMMPRQNRTLTDSDGVFVIREVRKGSIGLRAQARGYLPIPAANKVEIEDGGRVLDVKIKLMRAAAIAGTVVDDRGEPAIGATVNVYSNAGSGSSGRYERDSDRTDDRGVFRIGQLEPGDYFVGIPQTEITTPVAEMESMLKAVSSMVGDMRSFGDTFSSGGGSGQSGLRLGDVMLMSMSGLTLPPGKDGRLSIYESVFYPGVQRLTQATPVHLESGEEHNGVDLQLHLVPASTISGLVSGPSGPLGNAPVRLAPAVPDVLGFGSDVASTTTKRDGTFVLLGVPDGDYVVRIDIEPAPDMPDELKSNPMFQAIMGRAGSSKTPLFGRMNVAVQGADVRDLAVLAGDGASVSGRIRLEGDAKLTPQVAQQIQIELMPANGSPGSSGRQRVNADGTFKTASYPPGRYSVQVSSGALTPKSVMVDGHDLLREPMELTGREWSDSVVVLTDKTAELSGTVRADAPLPDNVILLVIPQDYQTWIANGMPRALTQTTQVQRSGAYRADHLLGGDYLVAAFVAAGYQPSDPKFLEAVARVASHVTIVDGAPKNLDLRLVEIKR